MPATSGLLMLLIRLDWLDWGLGLIRLGVEGEDDILGLGQTGWMLWSTWSTSLIF
jgi:hypothetical protein